MTQTTGNRESVNIDSSILVDIQVKSSSASCQRIDRAKQSDAKTSSLRRYRQAQAKVWSGLPGVTAVAVVSLENTAW